MKILCENKHQRKVLHDNERCTEAEGIYTVSSNVSVCLQKERRKKLSSSYYTRCFVYHLEYFHIIYLCVMWALCVWGFALKGVKCRNIFITLLHCLYRDVMNMETLDRTILFTIAICIQHINVTYVVMTNIVYIIHTQY